MSSTTSAEAQPNEAHGSDAPATGTAPVSSDRTAGIFEVSGSERAITIVTDPASSTGNERSERAAVVAKGFTAPKGVDLLQVVVAGGGNTRWRIVFDGKVVAEDHGSDAAHCTYRPQN
jgi:hypothetical protein